MLTILSLSLISAGLLIGTLTSLGSLWERVIYNFYASSNAIEIKQGKRMSNEEEIRPYFCTKCYIMFLSLEKLVEHQSSSAHSSSPEIGKIIKSEEGIKYDQGKPRLDLIPYEALEGLGEVLAYGAKKYAEANWAKGIEYNRLIAAALRHLNQFNSGIDTDAESNLSHISHALCNLAFLSYMIKNRPDLDNRWIKKVKE